MGFYWFSLRFLVRYSSYKEATHQPHFDPPQGHSRGGGEARTPSPMIGCVMRQLLQFQLYIFNLGFSTFTFSTYYKINLWVFNSGYFQLIVFSTSDKLNFSYFNSNHFQLLWLKFKLKYFTCFAISLRKWTGNSPHMVYRQF